MFDYSFTKQDLFIYGLSLSLGAQYSIDEPIGGPGETERTWRYLGGLAWQRKVSRKMDRVIRYDDQGEKSNLFDEAMQEHRVMLEYVYRI